MTSQLRTGIIAGKPEVILSGEVECDEVYVTAGHKGNPEAVKKRSSGETKPSQGDSGQGHQKEGKTTDFRVGFNEVERS